MYSIFLSALTLMSSPPMNAELCEDIREVLQEATELTDLDPAVADRVYNNCLNEYSWENLALV